MFRYLFLALAAAILLPSCKKDLLHWQKVQKLSSNTTGNLYNIRFINSNVAIIAGGQKYDRSDVLRSVDGGYTWSTNSYASAPKEMTGMGVAPNGRIYLCGIDGDVLHSADSGISWQFSHIDNWLANVGGNFPVADTGIFVNTILQRQCTITRVDSTFKIIDEQTYLFGLNGMQMTGPDVGYVYGYGTVMKTTNRGNTWAFQDVHGDNFTAMDIHGSQIWMCGSTGGVYHTYDGGNSWQTLRNGNNLAAASYMLRSIIFKDAQNGWACGDNGVVLYSNDGGNHWMEYDRFTTSTLRSIVICPNNDLLVAGDNGSLYRIIPN